MGSVRKLFALEPVYRVSATEAPDVILGRVIASGAPRGRQLLRDIYAMVDPQAYESGFSPSELGLDLQEIYERHHQ